MCQRNADGTYAIGHEGLKGHTNGYWKGDAVGYFGSHEWIYKHYGKANHCEFNLEHKTKRFEWANVSGKHKRNRNDYIQLCVSCHRKFDKGEFCSKGHPLFGNNLWLRSNGWRICQICNSERGKLHRQRRKVEAFVNL